MNGLSTRNAPEDFKQRKLISNAPDIDAVKLNSIHSIKHENEYKIEDKGLPSKENVENVDRDKSRAFKYTKKIRKYEVVEKVEAEFWCKSCAKCFSSKEEKDIHKQKHVKMKKYKCKICLNLVFDTEEDYFIHVNDVHKGKLDDSYMCSACAKQFKTRSELTQHNNSKCGTVRKYTCKVCGQKLMTSGSLHNHMLRHTVECSNMCGYCGKLFLTSGQLKVHERTHTQEKAFVCDVCGKGFCHRQSLITHSSIHTGIKPYQCENCSNSFSCVGNLIKHRKTHADTCGTIPLTTHRVNNPATKLKVRMNTPITSKLKTLRKQKEQEDKLIAYKRKLTEKTDTIDSNINTKQTENVTPEIDSGTENLCAASEIKEESCAMDAALQKTDIKTVKNPLDCNKLNYNNYVINYVNSKPSHKVKRRSDKSANTLFKKFLTQRGIVEGTLESTCQYCGKIFTNPKWLFRHEKKHESDESKNLNSYRCSCCTMVFPTREECKEHKQRTHTDLLGCKECDKIFSNKDSLRSHCKLFHKGIPKKIYVYVCEKCGEQFKQKAFLNFHEKNNCGPGPTYECHICGKGFHSIYTRSSHLRTHDPKKKFLCKFCGKSFRWKGQLKVHERSHTGEKPFKCLYCPKAFSYRESLITHSSLHTGIKPHLCRACGSRFSCIGNLIKHRTTHASTCGLWYSKNQ